MPKALVRDGELCIPLTDDIRQKLDVHEGEDLDAHVFAGSVTFTRTTEDARRQAGARMLKLIDTVRVRPGQPHMSPAQVDRMIDNEVKAFRRGRRRQRHG